MSSGARLGRDDQADFDVYYDLAIIGFGPAGAALALSAARHGARVLVLEQHRVPHDKLCGEFLSPDAIASLEALGVPVDTATGSDGSEAPRIDRVRITAPSGAMVERPLPAGGRGLSRLALDRMLATACRAAGVEIREQWRVSEIAPERGGAGAGEMGEVLIGGIGLDGKRARVRARVAAGAFGKGGIRDHAAAASGHEGSAERGKPGFIAWKQHLIGGESLGAGGGGAVELFAFPGGYCGVSPIEGGRWNICGIATRRAWTSAGGALERLIDRAAGANPFLARRIREFSAESKPLTVARLDFHRRRPIAAPLLQLGDAAAEIAPLAGDGIAMALRSAAIASPWVDARLGGTIGTDVMLAEYGRAWRSAFHRRLGIASLLQRMLLDARSATAVLRILAIAPPLADWLVRATRDQPAVASPGAHRHPATCAIAVALVLALAFALPACGRRENPPPPPPRAAKPIPEHAADSAGAAAGTGATDEDTAPQGDPMAVALARRVVRSMGGDEAWRESRCFIFTITDGDSTGNERGRLRRTHYWDRSTGHHRVEGVDRASRPFVVIHALGDSTGATATVAGKPVGDPAELDRLRREAEAMWWDDGGWLFLPWMLFDPGVRLTYGGTTNEEGKTWDVIEVAFDSTPGVGLGQGARGYGRPDRPRHGGAGPIGVASRYWVYVDRETGKVDRSAHIVKNARGGTARVVFDWQNWQRYGDIQLADRRRAVRSNRLIFFPELAVFESCPESAFTSPGPVILPAL